MKLNAIPLLSLFVLPSLSTHAEDKKTPPRYELSPPIDISGQVDFPSGSRPTHDISSQLERTCSLETFLGFPAAERHVYSFETWPAEKQEISGNTCGFLFSFGKTVADKQMVKFSISNSSGANQGFSAGKGASGNRYLKGVGILDWNGIVQHRFDFERPVKAFGVVLQSSGDIGVRKFFWEGASELNGFPVSYTLSDGTLVNLGKRGQQGALIKSGEATFLAVADTSGIGISSVQYTLKGLAGNTSQSLRINQIAFAGIPAPTEAPLISLRSKHDFANPGSILGLPSAPGLASLADFRFIVGTHRYVYDFQTRPSILGVFPFDLKGKGEIGQKVSVTGTNAKGNLKPACVLRDTTAPARAMLGGLGNIGKDSAVEHTFKFEKPVWAFGVTYIPDGDAVFDQATKPLSYTLSDGSVVDLAAIEGQMAAGAETFLGLIDKSGKGISSLTLRLRGTAAQEQPIFIGNIAFALAGPPPGNWTLTMEDNFDGDELNPKYWATGYTFPDVINHELQGFVPENVVVENGVCTIKVEKRDCFNTDRNGRKGAAQKFASGAFTSFDKFTQTYGYFEARVKMPRPRGAGIWPGFWMLPDRGREYPDNLRGLFRTKSHGMGMEIDIFEFMPWWQKRDGTFHVHCGCIWDFLGKETPQGYGAFALQNDGWGPEELTFPNLDTEFHAYGLYWSPERLIFYVDSKPIFRVKDPKNAPDVPHFIQFNIAMSGNGWGKNPDKSQPTMAQILEDLPNRMEIDYFRAYSGVLEEPWPTPPSDIPGTPKKYVPPPAAQSGPNIPSPAPAAPGVKSDVPPAPVNSTIHSPSNG